MADCISDSHWKYQAKNLKREKVRWEKIRGVAMNCPE
jgi:hypothetical protein